MTHDKVVLLDVGLTESWPCHGWVYEPPFPEPLARDVHRAFEVGVLLAGRQNRHFGGFRTSIEPGGIYLSSAWEPHGWQTTGPGTRLLVVQFLPQFLGDEQLGGVSWLSYFACSPHERPQVATPGIRGRVLEIAGRLVEEVATYSPGWETAVRIGLIDLLFAVGRRSQSSGRQSASRPNQVSTLERVIPAINLVHSRPHERVSVAEAAAACSITPSHFSVLFHEATGFSFAKFALRFRLHCAVDLLLGRDISEGALALEFGFHDASHFRRAFAKMYDCTPTHYRSMYAAGSRTTGRPGVMVPDVTSAAETE